MQHPYSEGGLFWFAATGRQKNKTQQLPLCFASSIQLDSVGNSCCSQNTSFGSEPVHFLELMALYDELQSGINVIREWVPWPSCLIIQGENTRKAYLKLSGTLARWRPVEALSCRAQNYTPFSPYWPPSQFPYMICLGPRRKCIHFQILILNPFGSSN